MQTTETTLEILKERGYRITQTRIEIIKAFTEIKIPLTIQALALKVSADEVSVYRTIATLVAEGLLEEIRTQGSLIRYALSHGHHHHVVCVGCDTVVHVDCHKGGEPKAPRHVKGFVSIDSHELTFYGRCVKCA